MKRDWRLASGSTFGAGAFLVPALAFGQPVPDGDQDASLQEHEAEVAARGGESPSPVAVLTQRALAGECADVTDLLSVALAGSTDLQALGVLADCYVLTADLLRALEVTEIQLQGRASSGPEEQARTKALERKEALERRIPTVEFALVRPIEGLQVWVGGRPIEGLGPVRIPSDTRMPIKAEAPGFQPYEESVILEEGTKGKLVLRLTRRPAAIAPQPASPQELPPEEKKAEPVAPPQWSLGGRAGVVMIPKFVVNWFGEGGHTIVGPAAAVSLVREGTGPALRASLHYGGYGTGEFAFRPNDAPITDTEIISSNLHSLAATVELLWGASRGDWSFRWGAGAGVGLVFAGNIERTQAYPVGDDASGYEFVKCKGPDNPTGTFRYCNQLDGDADHYNGFTEPTWFNGGAQPVFYPWVALPMLGMSYKLSDKTSLDLDVGLTTAGVLIGLGGRYGL